MINPIILEDCISSKVMRLSRFTANVFRKHIKPFGITESQLALLFILYTNRNLNQKRLSEVSLLEKSSLNRNLNRLFTAELITKDDFPIITITKKGEELLETIIPEWQKAMNRMEQLLDKDGLHALNLVLEKVAITQ
ncbi:MarR family transcriptional regulator [Ulvibacterium sp.]|uniref:MarR family winged helix-turn-helix transcriptional regulator n=1 Tax=Ulvibacterium sp. TaxID=2665914 RepID=UPI0026262796|nr:MarR family transcriptional regulator [Ulvibacterium sp.]